MQEESKVINKQLKKRMQEKGKVKKIVKEKNEGRR